MEDEKVKEQQKKGRSVILKLSALFVFATLAVALIIVYRKKNVRYSFSEIEKNWALDFNFTYPDPAEYEIHSLDIYCVKDDNLPKTFQYYVRTKYKSYNDFPEFGIIGWGEVDKVSFGTNGRIEGSYCLSWDNIDGFESVNEEFNKAVKEGHHKSYTQEEIRKLIEENPYVIEE